VHSSWPAANTFRTESNFRRSDAKHCAFAADYSADGASRRKEPHFDHGVREVNAPIEKAWGAWTTPDGIKTFFAPDCKVDLRVDGAYEIYFLPEAKPGERGSEGGGMRILGLEPKRRFGARARAGTRLTNTSIMPGAGTRARRSTSTGPRMRCGWGCGAQLTASRMRAHPTHLPEPAGSLKSPCFRINLAGAICARTSQCARTGRQAPAMRAPREEPEG
jgi:hypothetical protein